MKAHANRDVGLRINAIESTMTSRLMGFTRINRPIFLGYKNGNNPKIFLDVFIRCLVI